MRMPARRTWLKTLHGSMLPLFIWFLLVQPRDVAAWGTWAVKLHSIFGLIFVAMCLAWTLSLTTQGLASRPGPKLRGLARRIHRPLHLTIVWGLFGVAFTGFLLGLTASRILFAGTILPIAPPLGLPDANDWVGTLHRVEFYLLGVIVAFHAGFHIWRHYGLRDNALRIMAPKALQRFL